MRHLLAFILAFGVMPLATAYDGVCRTAQDVADLPPRHWCAVQNSRLESAEKRPSEFSDWNGSSSSQYNSFQRTIGLRGLIEAWNSAAFDTERNRLLAFGGGHNDYGGNEVYAFSLSTLSWTRVTDPTVFPRRSPAFQNNDGTPISRHTYSGIDYISHTDELFVFDGAPDSESGGCGTEGTWTLSLSSADWQLRTSSGEPNHGCDNAGAYDPVSQRMYWVNTSGMYEFNFSTNRWSSLPNGQRRDRAANLVVDPVGRYIVQFGGGAMERYDIDNNFSSTGNASGDTSIVNADDPGAAFDTSLERVVAWSGGTTVYTYDASANRWERVDADGSNLANPGSVSAAGGVFGRWRYSPASNVFVTVDAVDENVYLYRLSDGEGITQPSAPLILPE